MTIEGIEVNMGSLILTVDELFKIDKARRIWLKEKGLEHSETNTQLLLKTILMAFVEKTLVK